MAVQWGEPQGPTLREFREADARRWWIAPAVH
jgi:hypothetical protein